MTTAPMQFDEASPMTKIHRQPIFPVLIILLNACAPHISPAHQPEGTQPVDTPVATETVRVGPSLPTPLPTSTYARSWSPPLPDGLPREMAYLSNRTGLAEIWLLDLSTGQERRLTETDCGNPPTRGYSPEWYISGVQGFSWSPDGRKIAYLTMCSPQGPQLHVYDLEINGATSITSRVDANSYPGWAPSSDRFVFSAPMRGEVYIAEITEKDMVSVELITRTLCGFPTWSPNGRYIAYVGPEVGIPGTGSRTYLSVVDPEWNHLTYDPPSRPTAPGFPDTRGEWIASPSHNGLAWSNNSQYLAVTGVREYVPGGLALVEVTDQVAHKRSGLGPVSPFGLDFYSPTFSPDDEILYFVSVRPDAEYGWPFGTIYSVSVRDLLNNPSPHIQVVSPEDQLAGFPSLSPDGNWLVYAVKIGEAIEIWLQAVEGTYRQRLVGDGFVNTQPTWRPSTSR